MKPDQERHLEELFDAACALSPEARAAFLDRACAGRAAGGPANPGDKEMRATFSTRG